MKRITGIWNAMLMAAVLPVMTAGCLIKDTTETWYLDPGGTVAWSVTEADVRSDAQSVTDRQNEETIYITAVRAQSHPMAKGLTALGPIDVRTRILRGTVPFTVVTDARFASIAALGQVLIQRCGLTG